MSNFLLNEFIGHTLVKKGKFSSFFNRKNDDHDHEGGEENGKGTLLVETPTSIVTTGLNF